MADEPMFTDMPMNIGRRLETTRATSRLPESPAGAALRRVAHLIAEPSRTPARSHGQESWDTAIGWATHVLRHEANVEDLKELARGR